MQATGKSTFSSKRATWSSSPTMCVQMNDVDCEILENIPKSWAGIPIPEESDGGTVSAD